MKQLIPFLFMLIVSCTKQETRIRAERKNITESVYASITIQPDSLYKVYASVQGILQTQFVREGDSVNKGAAIAQIKNEATSLQSDNDGLSLSLSRKQYYGSNSMLTSIKNDIDGAQLKLYNDSINYYRQKRLWQSNIGSKIAFEEKKLNYELSKKALQSLKKKYALTKIELETQVKQAANNYQRAVVSNQDFKIRSAISGTVYAFYKKTGEIVNAQEPIALIGSNNRFIIEMEVDEKDIVRVTKGQSVRVILDAYKDQLFIATVAKIYPKKDERTQTFMVEAIFNAAPGVLYPGLTGEGNIIIAQKNDAMLIPKSYLIQNNKVRTDRGLVEITTGLQSMDSIEVISGITTQMYILKKED
jgi:multidrug efflux pump subunit AcrA (membrane-fusion protein)